MLIYCALVLVLMIPSSFEIDISFPLPGEAGMVCDLERTDEQSFAGCGILIDDFYPQFAIFDLRYASSSRDPAGEISSLWQYLQTDDSFISQGAMALDVCEPSIIPSIIACGQIRDISVHSSGIHITQSVPYEDFSIDYDHGDWVSSLLYDIVYLEQYGLWISCGEYRKLTGPAEPCGYIMVGNTGGIIQQEILEDSSGTWQSIEYDLEKNLALLGGSFTYQGTHKALRFGIYDSARNQLYQTSVETQLDYARSFAVKPILQDEQETLALQIFYSIDQGAMPDELIVLSLWSYEDPTEPSFKHLISLSNGDSGEFDGYDSLSVIAAAEVESTGKDNCEFRVLIAGADCGEGVSPLEWYLFVYTLEININDMQIKSCNRDGYPISTGDFIPSDFIFDTEDPIEGTGCGNTGLFSLGEISLFTLSENPEIPSALQESSTSSTPLEISVINISSDGFPSIRINSGNDSRVNLIIFDITGRRVISRVVEVPYYAELSWAELVGEQAGLASGIYLISADDNFSESMATAKILLH